MLLLFKKRGIRIFFPGSVLGCHRKTVFYKILLRGGWRSPFYIVFTVSDAIIVSEVEIFSSWILIFYLRYTRRLSVTMRRNFPSSKRVVIGSIDFMGNGDFQSSTFQHLPVLLSFLVNWTWRFFPVLFSYSSRCFFPTVQPKKLGGFVSDLKWA